MNELFIACLVGLAVWNSGLSLYILKMSVKQAKVEFAILMVSKRAAEYLHHADDRFKIDHLIDKYRDKGHDLTNEEWKELLKKSSDIASNPDIAKDDRLAAGLLHDLGTLAKELSTHKLQRKW